jgi:carbonic anhydrase
MLKKAFLFTFLLPLLAFIPGSGCQQKGNPQPETASLKSAESTEPKDPLERLIQGNQRFAIEHFRHPHQTHSRVMEVASGQHPFAVVLSCSDSRVPPDIIFDQGIGDLFIIRNAGNIIDDAVLGSIEYAVEHLGVELVLVMGHERCGAVTAAVQGEKDTDHIEYIAQNIQPACLIAKSMDGDFLDNSVIENVKQSVELIKADQSVIAGEVSEGHVRVVGARYDLDDGTIRLLTTQNERKEDQN